MNRTEWEKQTGDRLPDTLGPVTGSVPAPHSGSREDPAYQTPDIFQLSRSVVYELWAAVDRGDTNIFPPLAAALRGLIALGDLFAGDKRAVQEFNALKQRLSAVEAIAGTPMMDTDAANHSVMDHIRATARIIERLWKVIELGASPDQSGQFVSTIHDAGGDIKDLLELLSSFLEVFEVDPRLSAARRWGTIQEHLLQGQYALRISNHNSNTTYNFGRDVVNNNWCRVYVFSDGTDRKTPDLAKKQERVMNAIKIAIGDRYVPEALHDTQPIDSGCMPGTRVNVLSKFMSWVRGDPARILWLAGLAGTGKTCIAVTLCRLLLEDPDVLLGGAFFCSRTANRDERTDARCIFPTLAAAFAEQSPQFAAALLEGLKANPRAPIKDVGVQINQLIEQPLSALSASFRTIVFIIDALDECGDEAQVGQLLQAIASLASKATVKFIVTSRPETHIATSPIADSSRNSIIRLHLIDRAEVTEDIRLYITDAFWKQRLNTAWYTDANITALAARADGLFIFASTTSKYVLDGRGAKSRSARLQTALSAVAESKVALAPLDAMYMLVLTRASDDRKVEPGELEAMLQALACILTARAPLSVSALADLLGQEPDDLRGSLERLYAVLHVPETDDQPGIRTLHASFGDYLLARAEPNVRMPRSLGDEMLARGCFRVMLKSLHFNVAQRRSSYEPNDCSENDTRPEAITVSLEYSCLHWIYHVAGQEDPSVHDVDIYHIFRPRLLFWLEVMSVMGQIWRAISILFYAAVTVKLAELSRFLRDAHTFLVSSREPIERSAPHIYLSALPFEPAESLVYQEFAPFCTSFISASVLGIKRTRDRLVMTLTGHQSGVSTIAYSSDGLFIASGSRDGTVHIWNSRTGDIVMSLQRNSKRHILSLAFAPNGKSIACGTYGGDVCIWALSTARDTLRQLQGHSSGVWHVGFSSDGSLLASTSCDRTVRIWSVDKCKEPTILRDIGGSCNVTAFSPDGRILASGSTDGSIRLWDTSTGHSAGEEPNTNIHSGNRDYDVTSLCFSPDGKNLVACDTNRNTRVWELETGRSIIMPKSASAFSSGEKRHPAQLSSSGKYLVSAHMPKYGTEASGQFILRSLALDGSASSSMVLNGHTASVTSAALSPDGAYLASASEDRTIRIWDVRDSQDTCQPLAVHGEDVNSVAVSSDGATVVSGSDDRSVRLWSLQTGKPKLQPFLGHTQRVTSVAITTDGSLIASASADCSIRLWDAHTGTMVCEPLREHLMEVASVTFSSNSAWLASGSYDGTVIIWDVETKLPRSFIRLQSGANVCSIAFSPNGQTIGAIDSGGRGYFWNAASGVLSYERLAVKRDDWSYNPAKDGQADAADEYNRQGVHVRVRSLAFLPDGCHIVSSKEPGYFRRGVAGVIHNISTRNHVASLFTGEDTDASYVFACSPDGRFIVTGETGDRICDASYVRLFSADKGKLIATFNADKERVSSVVFTPDSRFVVHSFGKGIRVWDTSTALKPLSQAGGDPMMTFPTARIENNWIKGPSNELLLWVPPEYQPHLQRGVVTLIIGPSRVAINLDPNGRHYGENWTSCWCQTTANLV